MSAAVRSVHAVDLLAIARDGNVALLVRFAGGREVEIVISPELASRSALRIYEAARPPREPGPRRSAPRPPAAPLSDDLQRRIERARKWLECADPAISGSGGHAQTFKVALALTRGFALDEATSLGLLASWNERCQPPWSPAELKHKVRSALKQGRVEHGYLERRRAS